MPEQPLRHFSELRTQNYELPHVASPNPTRFAAAIITTIPTHSSRIYRLQPPPHSPNATPTIPPNNTYPLMCSIQFT